MEALPEAIFSTVTKRETAGATVLHTRAESTGTLETADATTTLCIFLLLSTT
jgi:hypothetical protein